MWNVRFLLFFEPFDSVSDPIPQEQSSSREEASLSPLIVLISSLVIVLLALLLAREARTRRALETLLRRLLKDWSHNEAHPMVDRDPDARRL